MALIGAWWLVRGRWRLIGWMAVTALVLFLLSLPFVGIRGWLDYATVLRNVTNFEQVYRNWALNAVAFNSGLAEPLPTLALLGSFAIAIGAMLFSLRRDRELSYIVTFTATLIASPLLWDHYMTNLLVPAAFMASRGRWYAIALPLLCVLPQQWLPFIAIAGVLVPFLAPSRGEPAGTFLDHWPFRRPAGRRLRAPPRSTLAGQAEPGNCPCTGAVQRVGAGRDRGAGGDDIVDQDQPLAGNGRPERGVDGEGVTHVARPCAAPEGMLSRRPGRAPQGGHDGQAQRLRRRLCQQLGLVEAALAPSGGVDGHRHQHLTADADRAPAPGHQPSEWSREPPLAVVLQGVQARPRRTAE